MPTDTIKYDWVTSPQDIRPSEFWMWSVPVIVDYIVQPPATGNWLPRPNPTAGLRESAWLNEHRDEIANADAPWVAILGDQVRARGATFGDVYGFLKENNIRDALVTFIRPRGGGRPYRIA